MKKKAIVFVLSDFMDDDYEKTLKIIGNKTSLNKKLIELISYSEELTKKNDGMKLNVAINYGGKLDLIHAIKKVSGLVKENKCFD